MKLIKFHKNFSNFSYNENFELNQTDNINFENDKQLFEISTIISEFLLTFIFVAIIFVFLFLFCFAPKQQRIKFKSKKSKGKKLILLAYVCILTSLIAVLFSESEILIEKIQQTKSNFFCDIIMKLSTITYVIAYLLTYIFVWYRMETLYKQPPINKLRTNRL